MYPISFEGGGVGSGKGGKYILKELFKERYANHTCSFRNERYRNVTELSKHIWNLKDRVINYEIKWRNVKQTRSYSNINQKCNLCLWEFFFISCEPQILTHNHRNELTSTCIHSKKFLLITVIANRMLYTRSLHFYHPITSRHVTLKGIVPILKCEYLRL